MKNILIIEDDDPTIIYLKHILKKYNLFILNNTIYENIEKIFINDHIDLALIDVKMSPNSGLLISKMLKEKYSDLKIIIQTATYGLNTSNISDHYLLKPYRSKDLLDIIESLIGS